MKYLGFVLHFYQPPWQDKAVLAKISNECYRPLLQLINQHPSARFTVNINYSLIELLNQHGYDDLLTQITQAVNTNKIELTGSGAYHPILPLLHPDEICRQIELNEQGIRSTLGLQVGKGFFPPEMAINPELCAILKAMGYEWAITDDVPFQTINGYVPFDFVALTNHLPIILRSHYWSSIIAFRHQKSNLLQRLDQEINFWFGPRDGYLVLGMDAETFGHHHTGYIEELGAFLDDLSTLGYTRGWRMLSVSDICRVFPAKTQLVPSGSWSTAAQDVERGVPYPLWDDPQNPTHRLLWELTNLILRHKQELSPEMRSLLDRSLNSCPFWWASIQHQNPACSLKTIPSYQAIANQLTDRQAGDLANQLIQQLSQLSY